MRVEKIIEVKHSGHGKNAPHIQAIDAINNGGVEGGYEVLKKLASKNKWGLFYNEMNNVVSIEAEGINSFSCLLLVSTNAKKEDPRSQEDLIKAEAQIVLRSAFSNMNMDEPENIDQILEFVTKDVLKTSAAESEGYFSHGDIINGFKRFIEDSSNQVADLKNVAERLYGIDEEDLTKAEKQILNIVKKYMRK
jgi:hypothetical protein